MNPFLLDLAAAERLIQLGHYAEARRILVALVDTTPLHGRAWYLLSRVAETNEQRSRFLRRARQVGYLDPSVPIDEEALGAAAESPGFAIDPSAIRDEPSTCAVAVKGGWVALVAMPGVGFCMAAVGGQFSADLGGLLLIFMIGSVVAVSVNAARHNR